jgi:ABC-type amino acid transport system permease subunit
MARGFRWLRALVAFFVTLFVGFPLLFQVTIWLVPNRTSDGHPVMPMGQAAFSIVGTPILAVAIAWFFGRPTRL